MKRKGLSRRLLSVLLALVMLLSLLPTAVFAATPKAKLVTDASELKAGDQIILTATANSKTYVAGSLSGKYLTSIETDPADPAANVEVFTLGGKAGAWTLTASDGKQIYTAAAKALNNAGKGTGTWTISIDANGLATVASTDTNYGRILYNVNSPRFMNYTSATNATMLLPSIYRLEVSSARQSGVIALENIQDGDKVVIFNPANGKALSTDYAGGFYNQATDVTLTDGKLTGYTDADLWTITKNTDGTYTIATADGKKLSMDTGYTSTPLDKANNAWKVTAVAGKDATYYIDNATRTDKYRLQYYATNKNWSAYTGTGAAFEQQLYLVIDSGSETPDPEPGPTALIKNGKYVIYNPGSGKAMSANATGTYYRAGKPITVTNGKVTDPAEDLIWTVTSENGVYTITTSDGKKLSMNADRNSLPLDEVNDTWKAEKAKTDGCFYLINANRPTYYVEWFVNSSKGFEEFTTYTYKEASDDLYTLQFIPVDQPLVADGKYVIYNPDSGKAMSANATGTYYRAGKPITVTNGKVDNPSADLIWTVSSTDGIYTITTSDGKKLSMNADRNSLPLDEVNDTWKVEKAKTDGCFYLINANRPTYYVEWFVNSTKGFEEFTTYTYKEASDNLYTLQFIPVSGSDQPSGGLPTVGSKVVIYNNNSKTAMAADGGNGSIKESSAVEIKDGKLLSGNGAAIFEVRQSGQYYRFYNDTYGYLSASGTGTGNKAYYSMTADENADWLVRTCSGNAGGYEMESRTAKFKGYSQWMEYYANGFTVYSMDPNKVTDYTIYSFNFYPVADTVATIGGIVNNPAVVLGKLDYAYVSTNYTFTFTVDAPFGVKGDVSAKLGTQALDVVLGEEGVYTVTVPAASLKGEGTITVTVSGTDNKNIAFSADAVISVKDEPMFANPSPARGFQTGDGKRPTISVELTNAGENPTITMTVAGKPVTATYANGKITYTPAADLADGRTEVTVTAKRADNKEASFNWFFTVGKTKYQAYFGQLHSHTQYSDGSGTLASALEYIKGLNASANIQFVAFTDHSNYFDKSGAANPEGALYDMSKATDYSRGLWSEYKGAIADFNAVNGSTLLALGGFEMTWSGGPGHINTFNTAGIVSRNNTVLNNKTADSGMKAYYALLSQAEGAESISQFNHPGKTFGNFSDFAYYDPVIDSRIYMVEVGNGEGQIGAGGYYPSYEQYIMALDKGWHLAPTNNQDNHKGRWGNANDARDVIITDDFSEAGIYEAIRAMRMYSTEDKNLELTYTVNGLMMGSSIKTEEVSDKLLLEVTVTDPDKTDTISKVEVVVNSGKVVHTWNDPAELAKGILSVSLDPDYSYYFIRVTQGDGDLAVTSPVWVGDTLKLGVSNLVSGTATPVTNEELTLTATLFNSEDADATVKSLTYTIGNTVIGVDKGTDGKGYTLAKSSTLDIPFKYTPTTARVFTVQVTAVVEQNNKEYTFTKTIELDVLDADSLVYIGIDASHYNEYVNGNYKDSMGNFGNLAAEYSVRTVQLNTGDELLAACKNPKFKAIILTAPSRRDDKKIRDPYATYSDAEIKAIADFNAAGGTVILAGWSDYYESYGSFPAADHMAAQQNLLLAAMGSSLRISDDATKDEVRSAVDGVETHRLYFSDYNMANPLNKGVIVDDDHPYDKMYTERFSHYGGASVYVVDANGTPTSKLPDTVSPVVYGHATTYSMDSDGVGVGGAAVPKYAYKENDTRLMVMATEQLEGKGMIIVSGAAFMSNFEVQATIDDNGAEKNYSNYRICENLVQSLNPVKITPISEVHQQPDEGVKYTIEGIVTSNASGYDQRTAFFDCIYVQDETGGINCFPVAGNFKIGDRVRVSGTTSSYQGERQLAVTKIEKIGEGTPVQPKVVTATQVNDGSVLGQLITLKGHVTAIEMAEGKVQTILVKDADGKVARVFIDGYICSDTEVKDLKVGCEIAATGLASYDNTFVLADGTAIAPRIRISNRADVVCTACTCGESGGDTPKTGDGAHMVLWVSMMTVTTLAGAALVLTRKRRS